MAAKKLTPKQQRFVGEYLVDLNATQAAIRAGYSSKTADKIGPELLGKTSISERIQKAMADREARTEITADYVLRRLKEESELTGEGSSHSARIKALELLGKHHGMFSDRLKLDGSLDVNLGLASLLEEVSGDESEGSEGADD